MILVFGTVCLDRIRHVSQIPSPGNYAEVEWEVAALGGEAANTASHLARWNAPAQLIGNSLAADDPGARVESYLGEFGLTYDTHAVEVEATPVCDVYVTPDGERTMFGVGFSTMGVPNAETLVPQSGGWFTTDGNFGPVAATYATKAREGGMRLYLMDLPPDSNLLGPGVIWHTSTRWVGERGKPEVNAGLVKDLTERTGCTAILSDSGNGLLVASPERPVRTLPVFPRPKVVDSTGAGDTLRAGILYGLDRGWTLGGSLSFGAAAASLAAEFIGAAEGPTLQAVQSHLAAHPAIASQYA